MEIPGENIGLSRIESDMIVRVREGKINLEGEAKILTGGEILLRERILKTIFLYFLNWKKSSRRCPFLWNLPFILVIR